MVAKAGSSDGPSISCLNSPTFLHVELRRETMVKKRYRIQGSVSRNRFSTVRKNIILVTSDQYLYR
ncbi:unnamed protein product [Brassica rapa subsp. trilocularis]